MASSVISTEMLAVLATALGCGLLVGLDRERRKLRGPRRPLAGLRTFALTSVSGAAAMLAGQHALVAVGALLVVGLAVVGYLRNRTDDPGVTTEVALFLTYLIGVLCVVSLPLAAGLAVVLTALLTERETLHRFATEWLTPGEMRDGIILLTVVLIGLPLLPNQPLWGPVLNPQVIGQLLALLLALQSLAHLSRRLLAAQQALALSSLASGFVSSTATVATLGMAVREGRGQPGAMAGNHRMGVVHRSQDVIGEGATLLQAADHQEAVFQGDADAVQGGVGFVIVDLLALRRRPRLARFAEQLGHAIDVGGLARSVDAFKTDEQTACHGV